MTFFQSFLATARDIERVFCMLPKPLRMKGLSLMLGMFPLALIELGVAGIVALFAAALADPGQTMAYSALSLYHQLLSLLSIDSWEPRVFLLSLACLLGMAIVCKNTVQALLLWQTNMVTELAGNVLGGRLIRSMLNRPYLWHAQQQTAELLTWVGWRMGAVNFLSAVATLVTWVLVLGTLLCGLFSVAPLLSLAVISVVTTITLLIFHFLRRHIRMHTLGSLREAFLASRCSLAMFLGFVEVLLYGQRGAFLSDYMQHDKHAAQSRARATTLSALSPWILETLSFTALVGIMVVLLSDTSVSLARTTGTLALLATVAWRAMPAVQKCLSSSLSIVTYRQYLRPYLELIDAEEEPEFLFPGEAGQPLGLRDSLTLEHVSLRYPQSDKPTLHDISLCIRKGEMVAFVGQSGAGKSTLVGILTGLLTPFSGLLRADGKPLTLDNMGAWRKSIGYVPQAPYIMDATLAENVAFSEWGRPPDRARVTKACRMAAIDFLDQLPQGADTPLGEQGVRLSGGQAQRVVIARALYHNPDIIIFDEATSALDNATEQSIQATINSLRGQLTVVLIAHRLSTVQECDRVFWLDKGSLRMQGAADNVLAAYKRDMECREG